MVFISVLIPILAGIVLLALPEKVFKDRKQLLIMTGMSFVISAVFALLVICGVTQSTFICGELVDGITVTFTVDKLGRLFAAIATLVIVLAGFFSFSYMQHEGHEKRYYGCYLITYGVLLGLDFSGNIITMYLFYEFMTLVSFPLVLHNESREAIMAGLKYLFYSFCGAYMALFGIYYFVKYLDTLSFTLGGSLNTEAVMAAGDGGFALVVVFLMILGFGVKAGLFPMHAWLPTAHPVAPAPASAVLSGIIVKGGVLAIIRVVYYCIGVDFLQGTWVQTVWMILTLITILMGSALAYKEKVLKKRLAYSTVSNLSYILFGLALLNPIGMTGSLLHVVYHAIIKSTLFLCAGAVICLTGKTKIKELTGIGKRLPLILGCFTLASLALIGIPPTSGVVSKWYLAMGALDSGIPVFSWLGPVVLLISALLTAGYLLSVTIKGFLPVEDELVLQEEGNSRVSAFLILPIVILAALTLLLGLFPSALIKYCSEIAAGLFGITRGGV